MTESPRFALVDALRGASAIWIVAYHVYANDLAPEVSARLPQPLDGTLSYGHVAVYVFFVLSGFVIAHSVRDARVTPGFVGRFALRRSLRLDPPYWVAAAAALVVSALAGEATRASVGGVAAHLVYAQELLGRPHIIGVFWSSSLEIQFYLTFVVLLMLAQRLTRGQVWWWFGPLLVLSLVATTHVDRFGFALFLWAWPYFFLGAITAWHRERRLGPNAWALLAVAILVALVGSPSRWGIDDAPVRVGVVAATAAILRFGGRALETATLGPLQYLGRISYSLYLTHAHTAIVAVHFVMWLPGARSVGAIGLGGLVIACVALTLPVAHVLYLVVERPSRRLARRISLVGS